MKSSTRDIILEEAFKIFLAKGYSEASFREIETAIGKTRGAIFHFFKSKEDLFRAVIDFYILDKQSIYKKVPNKDESLLDIINSYVEGVKRAIKSMKDFLDMQNPYKAYLSLILQAETHYVGFDKRINQIFNEEIDWWYEAIKKSQLEGEIQIGYNARDLAEFFRSVFIGTSYDAALNNGLNTNILLARLLNLYNLIKV